MPASRRAIGRRLNLGVVRAEKELATSHTNALRTVVVLFVHSLHRAASAFDIIVIVIVAVIVTAVAAAVRPPQSER
jgi:hypothetical protein